MGERPWGVLAFLWLVVQNLPHPHPGGLGSPTPSQGSVWLEWSQWGAGQCS